MTYAVVTRMPAGIVTPEDLEKVARIARNYKVPMLKVTSGQRIALVGLQPGDVQKAIDDLGPLAKPETAPCVKFVQSCLGTDMCKYGNQDSIGLAKSVDALFKDQTFPAKVKIGVSGCPRCCGESHTRDIGIMGTNRGWTVLFGGNGGRVPRFADIIAAISLLKSPLTACSGLPSITGVSQSPMNARRGLWNASELIRSNQNY
jgi:NAD(P)H-nitrite reductase large subunit